MNCEHAVKSYLHSIQEIIFRLPTEERGVLERSLVSTWGWCSLFGGVSRSNPQKGRGCWRFFRELFNPTGGVGLVGEETGCVSGIYAIHKAEGGEVRSVQGALQS